VTTSGNWIEASAATTIIGPKGGLAVLAIVELVPGPGGPSVEARPGDSVVIGRTTLAGLGLPQDPHMSSRHFVIVCDSNECHVRDLDSTNGTFVNGMRIGEAALKNGDRIEAGQSIFVIKLRHRDPNGLANQPSIASVVPGPPRSLASLPFLQISSDTHFPISTLRWPDVDNKPKLTVIVKATYVLAREGDDVRPTPKQLPIFNNDIMTEAKPPSIRFESDLVPFKPCTDVVLVGRAYAPEGKSVTELVAGLRVGQLRYGVAVIGDRQWQTQLLDKPTISYKQPFRTMDLVYERAFGGFDKPAGMYCKENHVGTGFIGKRTAERVEGLRLPNLEDPRNLIQTWNNRPRPVGFGFYGRGWSPRLAYAGSYDDKYMKERHPLLPADFSFRFFNGAHPDLQVGGYLRGDEEVDLLNVCPEAPRVHFRLPGLAPKIYVSRWTVQPEQWVQEHAGPDGSLPSELPLAEESLKTVLDTLVFVPDRGVFYEVFRAVCSLSSLESLEIARVKVTH
jgi:hypothetical protein